jgi:hypothetical protein
MQLKWHLLVSKNAALGITQSDVRLRGLLICDSRKHGVCGNKDKITAIGEFVKRLSVFILFSQGRITQTSAITIGQGVNERNKSLLYVGQLANGCYMFKKKGRLDTIDEVCFRRKT